MMIDEPVRFVTTTQISIQAIDHCAIDIIEYSKEEQRQHALNAFMTRFNAPGEIINVNFSFVDPRVEDDIIKVGFERFEKLKVMQCVELVGYVTMKRK